MDDGCGGDDGVDSRNDGCGGGTDDDSGGRAGGYDGGRNVDYHLPRALDLNWFIPTFITGITLISPTFFYYCINILTFSSCYMYP